MQTKLVAIVNVTPDSFSDGGETATPEAALERIRQSFADGASVVDIGAQSTRPGAHLLAPDEEWLRLARVVPEAVALAKEYGGTISVDTFHPEIAEKALEAGVHWINDVSGFSNPQMVAVVKNSDCPLVVMHALGIPADPARHLDAALNPVQAVAEFFRERLDMLEAAGIKRGRIILDPGIGFGKTPAQSLALILRAQELHALKAPLLYGHSRKSFLTLFTAAPAQKRDELTLAFSSVLVSQGVQYLRVHDAYRHAALLAAMDANMPHR